MGLQSSLPGSFTFTSSSQPSLSAALPSHVPLPSGGAVTLTGSSLLPSADGDVMVRLAGLPCAVTAITNTSVACQAAESTVSSHSDIPDPHQVNNLELGVHDMAAARV